MEVPCNAEKRLSNISSNEIFFEKAEPPYLEALKTGSGFSNIDMNFKPSQNVKKQKKCDLLQPTF